jgi:site-specific recombinase XerD
MPNSLRSFWQAIRPETKHTPDLSWEQAQQLYETVYMPSRNLAPRTRVEYRTDLEQLITFLKETGVSNPTRVGSIHLQAFLAHLDGKGLTGFIRRRKAATIRGFFGFLAATGYLSRNPSERLIPPPREYKNPRYLTTQEYRALINVCAHEPRDLSLIELILQTGMRLSEVARLTIHDIELPAHITHHPDDTGTVYVAGKGKKERSIDLNFKVCQALKAWLAVRPAIAEPTLFVAKFNRPMRPRTIQRIIAKYVEDAGIRHASVRTLRHSFGTHQVAKGTRLKMVQRVLGHEDVQTTAVYATLAADLMRREVQLHVLE